MAGGGTDDWRPATAVGFGPRGVAVGASGDLYIADTDSNVIRKVSASTGIITTVAGNGSASFSGDGGPATAAGLASPTSMALDAAGNLYFADTSNNRVRKVTASTGTITTVVGNGAVGFSGDGGPATEAGLWFPYGVALDAAGNLYVADRDNRRVRKVSAATGVITTVAGNGTSGFSGDGGPATRAGFEGGPRSVALDAAGNLYVASYSRIRKVEASTGTITTVAGNGTYGYSGDGGAATAAGVRPEGVVVDGSGNLHVADSASNRIRQVSASTGIITTVAGNGTYGFSGDGGPATAATLGSPLGLALDAAFDLYIADTDNKRIRKVVASTGVITTVAGNGSSGYFSGDGGAATAAGLRLLSAVGLDASGNLYLAEDNRVRRVSASTGIITTVAGNGTYAFSGDGGPATGAGLSMSTAGENRGGVALDASGNLYINDKGHHRVRRVSAATGIITTVAGNGRFGISADGVPATATVVEGSGLALDVPGNLYLAEGTRIREVSASTGIITTVAGNGKYGFSGDGGPATAAPLGGAPGVALDGSGDLYIADLQNNRIRKVSASTGIITTVAGNGSYGFSGDGGPATEAALKYPFSVAPDAEGSLYIADYRNNRIRKVSASTGIITTVAGNGHREFSGDGGPATEAALADPSDLALDASGDLYIADSSSKRVRAVFACRPALGAFDSSYPPDAAVASGGVLPVSWGKSDAAFRYDLLVDTDFPPAAIKARDVTGQGFQIAGLEPGKTYFWQVRAKGDPYCAFVPERRSGVRRFTVPAPCVPPSVPVLTNPQAPSSSTTLSFSVVGDAAYYDLYLGSGTPPPLVASGLTASSYAATGLLPGTTYQWRVVAHAGCNPEFTSSSLEGTFALPGGCGPPSGVVLTAPADGAGGRSASEVLSWQPSAGASTYDLHLGAVDDPPIYASGLKTTSLPVVLERGRTYRWKIVAHGSCAGADARASPTRTFATAACATPGAPAGLSSARTGATLGSSYMLAWKPAEGLEAGGAYRVERSDGADFAGAETFATARTSIVLTASRVTTYLHRVTAVSACGPSSQPSQVLSVATSVAPPHIEMLEPPRATVVRQPAPGLPLPRLEVLVKNTGTTDFVGFFNTSQTVPFFIMSETAISLRAGETRIFFLQFSGVPVDRPGVYEGGLALQASDPSDTTAYPQAQISLNITGLGPTDPIPSTTPPQILSDDASPVPIDFLRLPPPTAAVPVPEATIQIRNLGSVPLDLGVDFLPDAWLSVEPVDGTSSPWNAAPLQPGASRAVKMKAQRIRGESGGAFPRYTHLTLRTIDGKSTRLLVQDSQATRAGPSSGRGVLTGGETSLIVPSVVNAVSKTGGRYVSKVLITNLGPDAAQADLYYTPDTGEPYTDGFDQTKVVQTTLLVPGLDVVSLTDPLGHLFGATGSGQLEIRSPRIGQLRVQSVVDAPSPSGGSFGFQLPTVASGEGARQGVPYSVIGVVQNASYRTNVILTETSGRQAKVTLALYDRAGKLLGTADRELPPYAKTQISVTELSGDSALDAGAIEVTAREGSAGSVIALTTVIDNRTGDASSFVGRPLRAQTTSTGYAVASVVYTSTFQSRLEIRNNGSTPATYTLTYRGSTGRVESSSRTLAPRQEDAWENVLKDLLTLPPGTFGPLAISSDSPDLQVVSRVYASTASGTYGDAIEGIALDEPTTTGESGRMLVVDGLEGTADGDRSRGARTNLILTEIAGKPLQLEVALWEKSQKRVAPIGTMTIALGAHEQRQINDVLGEQGLGSGAKDRLNVLCTVRPKGTAGGRVIALATRIDNLTNDTKNLGLRP